MNNIYGQIKLVTGDRWKSAGAGPMGQGAGHRKTGTWHYSTYHYCTIA